MELKCHVKVDNDNEISQYFLTINDSLDFLFLGEITKDELTDKQIVVDLCVVQGNDKLVKLLPCKLKYISLVYLVHFLIDTFYEKGFDRPLKSSDFKNVQQLKIIWDTNYLINMCPMCGIKSN